MEKLKEHRSTIGLFILLIVVFIYSSMLRGIITFYGLLQNLLILLAAVAVAIAITLLVFKRFSFKKASKRELKAEDDILLQATAFSQATIFLILNNIEPPNDTVTLFKWLVPVAAISFYVLRAGAKLKDSDKYRYRSMLVFAIVVSFSVSVVFLIFLAPYWSGFFVIDGVDNTLELVRILSLPPYILPVLLVGKLRKRYGLSRQKVTSDSVNDDNSNKIKD